jgi:hypothetical protein
MGDLFLLETATGKIDKRSGVLCYDLQCDLEMLHDKLDNSRNPSLLRIP